MRIVQAAEINDSLTFRDLIEALRTAFRGGVVSPQGTEHRLARPDGSDATLRIDPAWTDFQAQGHSRTGFAGIALSSAFPDNETLGKASTTGIYLLLSGHTGAPLAMLDGRALSLWRTASVSALAASYLAREDAGRLLMVGAGALAPYLVQAHAAVRRLQRVLVWNRTPEHAVRLALHLRKSGLTADVTEDLEQAVRGADIVCCATRASEPLIRGDWLGDGIHLDLVGSTEPDSRESDDDCIERARLFVDSRGRALERAGDIVLPLRAGRMKDADIAADLFDLCRGEKAGRRYYNQITLFKSVGTALADFAAASHVFRRA